MLIMLKEVPFPLMKELLLSVVKCKTVFNGFESH